MREITAEIPGNEQRFQAVNICRSSGERNSREDVDSDSKQVIFAGLVIERNAGKEIDSDSKQAIFAGPVAERNSGKDRQKWTVILNK